MKRRLTFLILVALILATGLTYGKWSRRWKFDVSGCALCPATEKIEVHHIYPQWARPDLAKDTNNMVALCRPCHQVIGHFSRFRTHYNTNVLAMIEIGRRGMVVRGER
jgi:hypothetical protein